MLNLYSGKMPKFLQAFSHTRRDNFTFFLQSFIANVTIDIEMVKQTTRGLVSTLNDFRSLAINPLKRLCYVAELFPDVFREEKLCENLIQLLKKWLESAIVAFKQTQQGALVKGGAGQSQLKVAAAIVK